MTSTAPTPNQPGRWVVSRFGPPSVLEWHTWDSLPDPGPGEVRVRIIVTGISGADNIMRAGGYPDDRAKKPGFTPGYDIVGKVDSAGSEVSSSQFKPGDLVTSMCQFGGYATHINLAASDVIKLRPTDDPIKIGALPLNYMTAYGMLFRSGVSLPPGSSILIGSVAGGVGVAMAQLVRALDLEISMFGTCSPSKFDFIESLGVTPIDRHLDDLPKRVRDLNGGRGVTVAYDAVGSEKSIKDSIAATVDGTLRIIGQMSAIASGGDGMDIQFNMFKFIEETPGVEFFLVTGGYYFGRRQQWLEDFEHCVQLVRDGRMDPIISNLYPLSDAVAVNEQLVSGAGVKGKMEFVVDAELAKAVGL